MERRNGLLIGLLKYLHDGPKAFNEKPYNKSFKMPDRKDVEKKAKQILIKLYKKASEKETNVQDSSSEVDAENDNQFEAKLMAAMKNAMSKPASPNDKQFKNLGAEFKAFDATGIRSDNLENLLNALLSIKPTSVSSERAFSISGSFLTKRRARLRNSIVDDLCFSKDYLEKNDD